jgi:hypothetical protein
MEELTFFRPQGFIVEYGGMPEILSFKFQRVPKLRLLIISTTPASRCESGSVTLQATASKGIKLYDSATEKWHENAIKRHRQLLLGQE